MKALVTGGSGFCGTAIVQRLQELGMNPVVFDVNEPKIAVEFIPGSVLDASALKNACKGVDTVYHVSGILGTHELFGTNALAVDINIKGTVNVLEACLANNVENFMYPTKPYAWVNTYTVTKQAGEEFVKMFGKVYGMNVAILRWLNVYGPGQKLVPVRKAIPTMCVQALHGVPIEIYGSGDAIVDLVYSEDMAKVTVAYTELVKPDQDKRDIGCTIQMTVNEMVETIRSVANSKSAIEHMTMRMGEDSNDPKEPLTTFNANHMLSERYVMEVFQEGIRKTLDYYASIPEDERKLALEFHS